MSNSEPPNAGVTDRVEQAWSAESWRDVHVLVALSGGADSMALLRALCDIKGRSGGPGAILAAHVNHGIHPTADKDAQWVVDQSQKMGVPCAVRRADARGEASERGDGLEAAARSLRYSHLRAVAEESGARFVVTAHTADDQVETILHRILRGTGIHGLTGIPPQRPLSASTMLVRPLLEVTRQEVLAFLAQLGQGYREDPTNRDLSFTRNRIRHHLLPLLRDEYNPRLDQALVRLGRQAAELQQVVGAVIAELVSEVATISPDWIELDVRRLGLQPEPLIREVIRTAWRSAGWPEQKMGDIDWRRLSRQLHRDTSRIHLPGGIEAEVSLHVLRLSRSSTERH